jgi:hypothetical protein
MTRMLEARQEHRTGSRVVVEVHQRTVAVEAVEAVKSWPITQEDSQA